MKLWVALAAFALPALVLLARMDDGLCIPTEGDRGFRRMMTAESDDVDR